MLTFCGTISAAAAALAAVQLIWYWWVTGRPSTNRKRNVLVLTMLLKMSYLNDIHIYNLRVSMLQREIAKPSQATYSRSRFPPSQARPVAVWEDLN